MSHHASYATPRDPAQVEATRERLNNALLQEDIIAIIRASARSALGADGVTFILQDGALCHYVEEDAIGPLWKGRKFPMTSCISGWAMLNDQTAAIPDIYVDDRIPHDAYRPTFVKSLIMAPVRANGPVAALGAYWCERRVFTPEDTKAVEMMAEFVGKALRRVRAQ